MDIMDMLKERFGEDAVYPWSHNAVMAQIPDDILLIRLDKELIPFDKELQLCFEDPLVQLVPWCQLKVINNRVCKAVIIPAAFEAAVSEDELTAILYHELGHLHDPARLATLRGICDPRDAYGVELYADQYAAKHGYGRYIISALVKAVEVVVKAMKEDGSLGDPDETREELEDMIKTRAANLQQSIATFEQSVA
jgi:hypothetical protein